MRVTNNMIMSNTSTNINGTKGLVDKRNTQMTTQQKIARPSEDPVTAIRSLRMQTQLSKVDQYYEKNIPDATQWLDVTETALTNIEDVVKSMRTLCVNGSTGTLTQADRNTILEQLKSYQQEIYSEGNADYAGRTVFTGFRTDKNLTYLTEDLESKYRISQNLSATSMEEYRYYTNTVDIPSNKTEVMALDAGGATDPSSADMTIQKSDYFRMRLGYDNIEAINSLSLYSKNVDGDIIWEDTSETPPKSSPVTIDFRTIAVDGSITDNTAEATAPNGGIYHSMDINKTFYTTYTDSPTDPTTYTESEIKKVYVFENEADWASWSKTQTTGTPPTAVDRKFVDDNDIVIIKQTGDVIFGDKLQGTMQSDRSMINIDYDKYGFEKGELRPEYYFDCVDISDTDLKNWIYYDKTDEKGAYTTYDINYTVAMNQTLDVNMEACEVFDSGPLQDMYDLQEAVNNSIKAHEKVDKLKAMMKLDTYEDVQYQEKLQAWLDIANKEMDYYDDNLGKMFSSTLGKVDGYLSDIQLSLTKIGCTTDQLKLTESRMSDQQESVQNLLSQNDDLDLSEIILKYTAAYNAYQSSLTAAGKLTGQTLLNFI